MDMYVHALSFLARCEIFYNQVGFFNKKKILFSSKQTLSYQNCPMWHCFPEYTGYIDEQYIDPCSATALLVPRPFILIWRGTLTKHLDEAGVYWENVFEIPQLHLQKFH